ncbi:MAG: hypothetical protein H6765_07130 [Candidatus Peribacteria bacterium]|nr:MAG: hypothetical protein H6765_07130 [Candidatus Peribacteria bacterium]
MIGFIILCSLITLKLRVTIKLQLLVFSLVVLSIIAILFPSNWMYDPLQI